MTDSQFEGTFLSVGRTGAIAYSVFRLDGGWVMRVWNPGTDPPVAVPG